ncbi:hypothetical protein E2C01_053478 [Portunus trituberculatus]|uniref:Uncharacterized protein n=1 Tax=Portunus trituberculatus TaxID=210409 RepID=A0A5B7GPB0_PORTR|nr:hypothetical protein [Portunus trituberculatus]
MPGALINGARGRGGRRELQRLLRGPGKVLIMLASGPEEALTGVALTATLVVVMQCPCCARAGLLAAGIWRQAGRQADRQAGKHGSRWDAVSIRKLGLNGDCAP